MKLAVDVHYHDRDAVVAGVAFLSWSDEVPFATYTTTVKSVSDYVPGSFYRRELPCILRILDEYRLSPECILIDGYVYLDGNRRPGLGSHLYDALKRKVMIIGVAKQKFAGISDDYAVYRGDSRAPLYVTCAGMPLDTAKQRVGSMYGAHRLPQLLKLVGRKSTHGAM